MFSKLDRYFIKQVIKGTISTFVAVALLVAVAILYKFWRDGHSSVLLEVLLYSLPRVFTFALPVSFFSGIVLAVGEITSSRELTILRSSGISMVRLYIPILLLALFLSSALLVTWDRIIPAGERQIAELVRTAAFDSLKRISLTEKRRVVFDDMTISLAPNDHGGVSVKIVSESKSGTRFINANDCKVEIVENGKIARIILTDGFISSISDSNYPQTNFEKLNFEIPGPGVKDPKSYISRNLLSLKAMHEEAHRILELSKDLQTEKERADFERLHLRYLSFLHYIVASALAPIFLVIIAIPLGLLLSFGNKAIGIGSAILYVFVVFYPLLLGGRFFADSGAVPAWIVMEAPNFACVILGFFLAKIVKK